MLGSARERRARRSVLLPMSARVRSLDDLQYYREREAQCRKAAAEATDPSARVAHAQLADFYARRVAAADEKASADPAQTPAR